MHKLVKRKDLKNITEKDAIIALSQGYTLKDELSNKYLIIQNEQLMIIEEEAEELTYYKCNHLDLPILIVNGYSVYELKEIPWYDSAPKGKPIICYPLLEGKPDKTQVVLLTLVTGRDDYDVNGYLLNEFLPVPKDDLLSYLYLYK